MKKLLALLAVAVVASIAGCYYDNMDDVYPGAGLFVPCDTTSSISYQRHIVPILENNCVSCHTGGGASAGIHLDTYNGVLDAVSTGQLIGATWHEATYTPMPPNFQLDSCSLVQIKKWVDAGAPNN